MKRPATKLNKSVPLSYSILPMKQEHVFVLALSKIPRTMVYLLNF